MFAELKKQPDIKPFIPRILATGGGYVSQTYGLYSLWYNPAGLAYEVLQHDKNHTEITPYMLSGNTNGEVSLYGGLTFAPLKIINKKFKDHYFGIGYAGLLKSDEYSTEGESMLKLEATGISQSEMAFGYAYKHDFHMAFLDRNSLDPIQVRIGTGMRPLIRNYSYINSDTMFAIVEQGVDPFVNATVGGIGLDYGIQFDWENFITGLAVRNVYTYLFYSEAKAAFVYSDGKWQKMSSADHYVIPMSVDTGVSYSLELGGMQDYFIPRIYFQVTDVFMNTNIDSQDEDFVKHIHTGINFQVLPPFFDVQFGMNRGYFTTGMSANIWFFDAGMVLYMVDGDTQERETGPIGVGFEAGVRW